MLRVQNSEAPAEVRHSIVDVLDAQINELRIAAAYVTLGGSKILFDCLSKFLSQGQINRIPKTLITALDFGITEPAAIERWRAMPNTTVHVAGAELIANGVLIPSQAFHPKIYTFGLPNDRANMLIGSANMTTRGFSINSEAVWLERDVQKKHLDTVFSLVMTGTTPITNTIVTAYTKLRKRTPRPKELRLETAPVPAPQSVPTSGLMIFRDAVDSGAIDPVKHREMWIQVDALQGGSGNQLELPRGAHRFFGFRFTDYDYPDKKTIGIPILRAGARQWRDRLLTWHGNNKMERINLPTQSQGGFSYVNSAIFFRRLSANSFELVVATWDSDLARSWREASRRKALLFRLGSTHRLVGLI